ncbi:MAG: hypothetical protein R3A51_01915 [Nannocystaceae bacterium]
MSWLRWPSLARGRRLATCALACALACVRDAPRQAPPPPTSPPIASAPADDPPPELEPVCDAALLAERGGEIVAARAAWTADLGRPLELEFTAAQTVWQACPELPHYFRNYLHQVSAFPQPDWVLRGEPRPERAYYPFEDILPGYNAFMATSSGPDNEERLRSAKLRTRRAICPALDGFSSADVAHQRKLQARLFDECQLARFGVVTREELVAIGRGWYSLDAHSLYQWLIDHGAPPDAAGPLIRELVLSREVGRAALFLRDGQRLPASPRAATLADAGLVLEIVPGSVVVDDHPIPLAADMRVLASEHGGTLPQLRADVALAAGEELTRAHAQERPPVRDALLIADPDAPWSTVLEVAKAAHEQVYKRLTAAVLVQDAVDPIRALELHSDRLLPARLSLTIEGDALRLACGRARPRPVSLARLADAAARCPGDVTVHVDPDVRLQRVITALARLDRSPRIAALDDGPDHEARPRPARSRGSRGRAGAT